MAKLPTLAGLTKKITDAFGQSVKKADLIKSQAAPTIGGVRPAYCLGGRVRFLNGRIGVINQEKTADPAKTPSLDQMFIDLGSADHGIKVGDVAAFDRTFEDLGERVVSKALDDRVGVAVLISALRQLKSTPHEVYFVFSVQEEVGVRGATTAAFHIAPDVGIVPIGDRFTMRPETAALACDKFFDFKTIIPCHYKTFPIIEQTADGFISALGDLAVKVKAPEIGGSIEI